MCKRIFIIEQPSFTLFTNNFKWESMKLLIQVYRRTVLQGFEVVSVLPVVKSNASFPYNFHLQLLCFVKEVCLTIAVLICMYMDLYHCNALAYILAIVPRYFPGYANSSEFLSSSSEMVVSLCSRQSCVPQKGSRRRVSPTSELNQC